MSGLGLSLVFLRSKTSPDKSGQFRPSIDVLLCLSRTGKLRKVRNHVTEFGSTGAMATTGSCLVSAGYDLDRGNGYLNGKVKVDGLGLFYTTIRNTGQ